MSPDFAEAITEINNKLNPIPDKIAGLEEQINNIVVAADLSEAIAEINISLIQFQMQ